MSKGLTLLRYKQLWGDSGAPEGEAHLHRCLNGYGPQTPMSDLAILQGVEMDIDSTRDGQKTGCVWSASSYYGVSVYASFGSGIKYPMDSRERNMGVRPALTPEFIALIPKSECDKKTYGHVGGAYIVKYGEYPQTMDIGIDLEEAFLKRKLKETGKKYTFDGQALDACKKPFKAKEHKEYEQYGDRYIRVKARPYGDDSIMSNGELPKEGSMYWVEVQPIEWLMDRSGVWVARQGLFGGMQLDSKPRYDGNFQDTDMNRYLQNIFMKEIKPVRGVDDDLAVENLESIIDALNPTAREKLLAKYVNPNAERSRW